MFGDAWYLLYLFYVLYSCVFFFFFFKQKTAYEMRISDWSSDVCSSDLTIKNPVEWGWAQLTRTASAIGAAGPALHHIQDTLHSPAPTIRRIGIADVREALAQGFDDFGAFRSDRAFLCVLYPVIGLHFSQLLLGGRTRGVEGKSVSVRVAVGGGRYIKKKQTT